MNPITLLSDLRRYGITVRVRGEKLRLIGDTASLDAGLLEQVREHKQAILDLLRNSTSDATAPGTEISRAPREGALPTSYAQDRLWFLEQLSPGNTANSVASAFRLTGALDVPALNRSVDDLVARHEALRTAFAEGPEGPEQRILAPGEVEFREVSLEQVPDDDIEDRVQAEASAELERPFDLGAGPLLRVSLLRLSRQEHVLLLVAHHIAVDGWSFNVLHRDLAALYAAHRQNDDPRLPELALQYADYAVWERRQGGSFSDRDLRYWKERLSGAPTLDLPTDHPRPPHQSSRGAREQISIAPHRRRELERLAHRERSTLFMTLLTAMNTLLLRYSGQDDLVVGTAVAGRRHTALEETVGLFANTLVIRTDLNGDPTFLEALATVREGAVAAYQHQDVPFERLVREIDPVRDPSRNPLFQVFFSLHDTESQPFELPGLETRTLRLRRESTQFDLSVYLRTTADGIEGFFSYNTDLFDAGTIRSMVRAFDELLGSVVADPDRALSRLPLLGSEDRAGARCALSGPEAEIPHRGLMHGAFESQSAAGSHRIAVDAAGESLDYLALDRRANRLAHHLVAHGVGPGTRVALCVDRGIDMPVALLGILKAGGAYIPLDPAYPQARLAYMLEDASPPVLVTTQALLEGLPAFDGAVVVMDRDRSAIEGRPDHAPAIDVAPDDTAYVIYTSGSTGRPKGVQIRHGAVANFLASMAERPGMTSDDVLLAVTTLSFDIAVLELFLPLSVGAKVVIASRDDAADGRQLQRRIETSGASVMQGTPATWQLLLHAGWKGSPGLKMLCGGEALPRRLADELLQRGGELWNVYGPTETTIWSSTARVTEDDGPIHIGDPIRNTRLYVLDRHLEPVPPGMPGELHIGGAGLASGYLGRPELTAEMFVACALEPDGRVYKTGDLVRRDGVGRTRFLGRIDHQVKVRGFRIELGEIESVLAEHPEIEHAATIVRGQGEDCLLVAFVVPRDNEQASPARLREFLRSRLPEYMVPNAFVFLDALPLSPAGKLDRRRLSEIEPKIEESATTYTAPRGPEEEAVASAFSEFLGHERVGAHDNFFDLGGHSLLATRLVSRLRSTLLVDLPLRDVFEHPTVAGLGTRVRVARRDAVSQENAAPIRTVSRDRDLELSFAQRRLWVLDQMGAGAAYNMHRAYRLRGTLDRDALEGSIHDLTLRHEALRTRFVAHDGHPLQVIDEHVDLPFEVTDLSGVAGPDRDLEIQAAIDQEAGTPFDLSVGPLIRTRLVNLGGGEHLLLLTVHHIVCDGWSAGLLARDIAALYQARLTGEPADLPELPVQYPDFAAWQNERLQGEMLERQLSYWKDRLGGDLPILCLPTDRPRQSIQTFRGASHRLGLSRSLSEAVQRLARKEGVTVAMVLLAAYQALLSRYTGQEDVIVGSPIANRTRSEIEDLIGFFVNSLVLRADLSGNPSFSELLRRVHRLSLDAYDHQDLPFEQLVNEVRPERDLSQNPLFQVVFAMQNVPSTKLQLPGLVIEDFPTKTRATRFDLELHLSERPTGIGGLFVYNQDLFDASTVERMASHLTALIEGAVGEPDRRLSELPLMGAAERDRVVVEWNDTDADYPDATCIHRLFEARVAESPYAPAVIYRGQEWTYGELDLRANRLAHALCDRGVRPDSLVGLSLERGPEMIVGMLGILKAGGAYVPIDPSYPRDRVAFMLADSGVKTLLTQQHLRQGLPPHEADVLCLDADWPSIESFPAETPSREVSSDDLAYAIYTSGSTGTPKCALLRHRGLCNVSAEQARAFGVGPGSRVLQFSSLSFDASTFEIVMALPNGATLVLGDPDELLPGPDLLAFLKRHAIEIVTLPPTALAAVPVDDLPALRTITVAGEACSPDLVARWAPGRRFFNLYGPTETTIWATSAQLRPGEPVHIGRPIANTRVYVLDRHLAPVPVGVPGEMCIGGAGVARGYHNREDLSAERFVPDPFSEEPGERLYRTGDLARFRADGNIEFLGRIDHQVKVRGFRIELGEIEAALDNHPAVGETVVLAREDVPGDRRLVAYVVEASAATDPTSEEGETGWNDDHVSHWETLYEQSYGETWMLDAGTFNISGWNSSYSGDPIPDVEMRRWVDTTVEAMLANRPRRILELGCGNGLLLFRAAPHCEQYMGCDFSQAALDYVLRNLGELGEASRRVILRRQRADDFAGIEKGSFDTVVLNSVVQYFPGADYLLRVLEGAIGAVRPGGRIFIGDLRSMPLFRAFHASVQAFQAEPDLPTAQLRQRVEHQLNQDQELVVEPEMFVALKKLFPRISEVTVRPKPGGYDNELSRFRYDVTLYLDEPAVAAPAVRWVDWHPGQSSPETLERELAESEPEFLGVRGVPNARVLADVLVTERLDDDLCPPTTDALLKEAREADSGIGIDPDRFIAISEHLPYQVQLDWAASSSDGAYDVLFVRRDTTSAAHDRPVAFPRTALRTRTWASYTNDPLRGRRVRHLVPELRRHLKDTLPDYMIPSAFVVLAEFSTTPSGKIDRKALPAPDAVRPESAGAFALPRNDTEEALTNIWARVLGIERVGIHDNFFELGGDSILSIQVVSAAREAGVQLGARDMFLRQTVAELAAAAQPAVQNDVDQGPVTGPLPLTPIEHWFLDQDPKDAHHFNQALFLESTEELDEDLVRECLKHLIEHHDALRSRLRPGDEGWTKEIVEPGPDVPFETVEVPDLDAEARHAFVEREAARIEASLDLEHGPLLRLALFRARGVADHLLFVIHHFAVDAVSWPILVQDLQRAMAPLRHNQPVVLPQKSTSVRRWAEALVEHAGTPEVAEQAAYWLDLPLEGVGPIPRDHDRGDNTVSSIGTVTVKLPEDSTSALLQKVPAAYGTRIDEVLLTALARALGRWTGSQRHIVDVEGHGREPFADGLDTSRTVGWFTSIYPVLLEIPREQPLGEMLKAVKERVRSLPSGGLTHGLARWISPDAALSKSLSRIPAAEIAFNYLGRFDGTGGADGSLRPSDWPRGPMRSPLLRRAHLLEINAVIRDGRFAATWAFSRNRHRDATVERLAGGFLHELTALIEHCTSPEAAGYTPSDFGNFGWDQDDLDDILAEAEGGK